MDTFDPDVFMNQTVDSALETDYRMCPEGVYQAMIDDFTREAFGLAKWTDKNDGSPRSQPTFNCPFVILDEKAKAEVGREKVLVEARMFLDMNGAQLDTGPNKNVLLGRIRNAVGQNSSGSWTPSQLRGSGPLMVTVKHEPDRKDPAKKYARVTNVAPCR